MSLYRRGAGGQRSGGRTPPTCRSLVSWKRNVCQQLPGQLFEKNSLQRATSCLFELTPLRIWEYRDQMCKIL